MLFKKTLFPVLLWCIINYGQLVESKKPKYVCKPNLVNIETQSPITNLAVECPNCIPKCCSLTYMLMLRKKSRYPICVDLKTFDKNNYTDFVKNSVIIYKNYKGLEEKSYESKNFASDKNFFDFPLMQNRMFENGSCIDKIVSKIKNISKKTFILESAKEVNYISNEWYTIESEYYCTDVLYYEKNNSLRHAILQAKEEQIPQTDLYLFMFIASLISAFFLVLVFLVYCVLPQLRVLSGMLLMAYVSSMFLLLTMKATIIFKPMTMRCSIAGPIFYFGYLSTLFWLNVMSFDIWWAFRAQRYRWATNRRGVLVKFAWYSLYAWGLPLATTIISIIIFVKREELPRNILNLSFDSCLNARVAVMYYLLVPAGVITLANIVLYVMTVYNIWLINKEINKFNATGGNTNKNKNRFRTYLKLSLLMGVSWAFEIIPLSYEDEDPPEWLNIMMSSYNFLIGFIIFIIFIVNKKTLKMLCIRFNIKCHFLDRELNLKPSSRSTATKSSYNDSYHRTRSTSDSNIESNDTEVCSDPKHEDQK